MGDYNSKHEFFCCKKYNKEGDILFNILEELNLIVTNDGTPTHYTNTSSDILDLCIVSRSIATKVDRCTVGLDVGSDHMPVHLVINSSKIARQNQIKFEFSFLIQKRVLFYSLTQRSLPTSWGTWTSPERIGKKGQDLYIKGPRTFQWRACQD